MELRALNSPGSLESHCMFWNASVVKPERNRAFHRIWLGQGVVVSVASACVREKKKKKGVCEKV